MPLRLRNGRAGTGVGVIAIFVRAIIRDDHQSDINAIADWLPSLSSPDVPHGAVQPVRRFGTDW